MKHKIGMQADARRFPGVGLVWFMVQFFLENNLSATSWRLFLYGQLYGISHTAIFVCEGKSAVHVTEPDRIW